jgi:hypothetical protein
MRTEEQRDKDRKLTPTHETRIAQELWRTIDDAVDRIVAAIEAAAERISDARKR